MSGKEVQRGCGVCGNERLSALYQSPGSISFTSAQVAVPVRVRVEFCRECGHAQTPPLENIDEYYDRSYDFRNRSLDEDDVYEVTGDRITFRAEHQAAVIERTHDMLKAKRVLDYGCGKAATLRKLFDRHAAIVPYVFDVSEAYSKYWDLFVEREHRASYAIPESWLGEMDLVLSLFSLEHAKDPKAFVRELKKVLKTDGRVHLIVPDLYRNASDLLVVDHVSHFSCTSLTRLFREAGFAEIKIDRYSHRAALILTATLGSETASDAPCISEEITETERQATQIAAEWEASAARLLVAASRGRAKKMAIYGSGVYGLFIASTLPSLEDVAYFVDISPYRQGLVAMGRPVIAPQDFEDDVQVVLVGLNPQDARRIVEQAGWLHTVEREFVFL